MSEKEKKRHHGRFMKKQEGVKQSDRKDAKLKNVIINEKRNKKVRSPVQARMLADAVDEDGKLTAVNRTTNTLRRNCRINTSPRRSTREPSDCPWVRTGSRSRRTRRQRSRGLWSSRASLHPWPSPCTRYHGSKLSTYPHRRVALGKSCFAEAVRHCRLARCVWPLMTPCPPSLTTLHAFAG